MAFLDRLQQLVEYKALPKELAQTLTHFYASYERAVMQNERNIASCEPILSEFLELVIRQIREPFVFQSFHEKITTPKDLYRFGIDFIVPLVRLEESTVIGLDSVDRIQSQILDGQNVILFANHQIEPDPQAISLLLERTHPMLAQEMIFVAGHKVTTDPLAVPFSMGRNLLCIYSKNYIDHPPENKQQKIAHNHRTIKRMRELLSEGGKCIYVAPSGGRDRPNENGQIEVAKFDPQSIEMFQFIANRCLRPTHFYPLALNTYRLLPPPGQVNKSLGETRLTQCTPIHLAFGSEINFDSLSILPHTDKLEQRKVRADSIWNLVNLLFQKIR
jgi:glycerol-3-phosphate O-acyltransferase